jgi:hypothetical protein
MSLSFLKLKTKLYFSNPMKLTIVQYLLAHILNSMSKEITDGNNVIMYNNRNKNLMKPMLICNFILLCRPNSRQGSIKCRTRAYI